MKAFRILFCQLARKTQRLISCMSNTKQQSRTAFRVSSPILYRNPIKQPGGSRTSVPRSYGNVQLAKARNARKFRAAVVRRITNLHYNVPQRWIQQAAVLRYRNIFCSQTVPVFRHKIVTNRSTNSSLKRLSTGLYISDII